jgi:hypothetical protein
MRRKAVLERLAESLIDPQTAVDRSVKQSDESGYPE